MAVLLVSMDCFALATLPTETNEATEDRRFRCHELRDNLSFRG